MFGRRWNPFTDRSTTHEPTMTTDDKRNEIHQRMLDIVYPAVADRVAIFRQQLSRRLDALNDLIISVKVILSCYHEKNVNLNNH